VGASVIPENAGKAGNAVVLSAALENSGITVTAALIHFH